MNSKLSNGIPPDGLVQNKSDEQIILPRQTSTSPSKSELLPVLNGGKKTKAADHSRQHLYPSYKRLHSKISLPPIDSPPSTLNLDTQSDESFSLLRTKLLNPEAQKQLSPQEKPKRVALKKTRSTQSLPTNETQKTIKTSSSEKHLQTSKSPQRDLAPKDTISSRRASLEGTSVRRLSMAQRLSLAKVETPTSRVDQWTVLSSAINSALRIVVDS